MCARARAYAYACMRARVRARIRACVRACVGAWVRGHGPRCQCGDLSEVDSSLDIVA